MTSTTTKINFNAGPAALPQEVLQQASQAVLDYNGTGLSILEIPHRGKDFDNIIDEARALVKELANVGDDYEVLWLHGGGRLQFCMVPMNFLGEGQTAGYIDSGHWAAEAIEYGEYYGKVNVLASSKTGNYRSLPQWPAIPTDLAYLHYTTNNTIFGTQYKDIPETNVPLIADMSSDIFSRRIDYTKFALVYAVAQKNMGPAGATMVLLRKDMLGKAKNNLPPMLSYAEHIKHGSVLNTPPVFAIYTSMLYLRWMKAQGIDAIEKQNDAKAAALYAEIDRNPLFEGITTVDSRSTMNACFKTTDAANEEKFLQLCAAKGMVNLKGHRAAGAFRVSLYNAISLQQVQTLVAAMQEFEHNTIQ